jgi:hypothetical protein
MDSMSKTMQKTPSKIEPMLNELQKKISGQRAEKLTPVEINRLFNVPVTPEFNATLYLALKRQAIDPDVTILQAIPRARTREYLIPIAMCLRFGADANMYVDVPKFGKVHLLGYVYYVLGGDRFSEELGSFDENVLNSIILMLVSEGSRPSLPMFDARGGRIRGDGEERVSSSRSVVEWLDEQGYANILDRISSGDPSNLAKIVNKDSMVILSILLDNPLLMGRDYEPRDMNLAIRAFSSVSFDKIPTPETMVMRDYKSLDESVTYFNSYTFEQLVKRGQMPSYLLINKILINMKTYKTRGHNIVVQELEKMLISSVNVGVQLDPDQMNIISTLGKDTLDAVNRDYEQPYWRKICRAPDIKGEVPEPLRRLAISLNIDHTMSKAAICENISNLSKADKESLKEAAKRRQQMRMSSDLGTINEFIGGKTPTLVCRNRSVLPHDPFDYNDIDLAYYRDDQGAVWCFGSDTFESILETGINPYNSTILPDSFKEQLKFQINALKRLGINNGCSGLMTSRIPLTFSKAIDNLTSKDTVSENPCEQSMRDFIQLANLNNVSADTIRNLTKQQMIDALRTIDYDVDLSLLSTSHALATTSRIISDLNRTDPDSVPVFFGAISLST